MVRILIIEDEASISRFIELELKHEGYSVEIRANGKDGLDLGISEDFDLIILDLMLPGMNGLEVLRRLRLQKSTPVIILTARDQVMDKVIGLDVGADDYMSKPFAIEELLARIRVILKRKAHDDSKPNGVYKHGSLALDSNNHTVTYGGAPVTLTRKEYDLLLYLLENKNKVVSREKILDAVWGYDYYGDTNVVDVYIRYIRQKIDERFGIQLIHTLRGTGYIIKGE